MDTYLYGRVNRSVQACDCPAASGSTACQACSVTADKYSCRLTVYWKQVYLTGHGGEDFLKFQDKEELTSQEVAAALGSMRSSRRYRELLFIVDTCQAASMFARITAPNVFGIGSSKIGGACRVDRCIACTLLHIPIPYACCEAAIVNAHNQSQECDCPASSICKASLWYSVWDLSIKYGVVQTKLL